MQKRLTAAEITELKRARAALESPFDRIAFDNQWIEGVPVGLIILAHDEVEAHFAAEAS